MTFPETNDNLIAGLRDPTNDRAWVEFVSIYRPAIMSFAVRKGMQICDAEDLTQNVLVAVAGAIDRWESDPGRARFSTWLSTIATRKAIDAARTQSKQGVCGGTSIEQKINESSARSSDSQLLRMELRRQLFLRGIELVRTEFSEDVWASFWMMAVENQSAKDVAEQIHKSPGAVYAAKGRVMRRVIQRVREMELDVANESGEFDEQ